VQAADRALCLKSIIKTAARRKDALAVFMARLSDVHEPAGMHLNLSLRASVGEDPVFFDTAAGHLSPGPVMAAFLGGLQACLPDLFLLLAPTVNSWKRFQAAAFVPTTNSWGVDNKTAAYRVVLANPRETRVEVRLPGADTHPHLALAAVLAAGRKGIEDQLRPTQAVIGDAHASDAPAGPCFPASFADAITRWRGSRYAREFFGPEFVQAYADSRAWQLQRLERTVTDWEVRQFAECV
jgi:glutamine synthetase